MRLKVIFAWRWNRLICVGRTVISPIVMKRRWRKDIMSVLDVDVSSLCEYSFFLQERQSKTCIYRVKKRTLNVNKLIASITNRVFSFF
mmetsp:Transcript_8171/g.13192  ORF Transcript_8171/g.13192 Transcript_8171/m.13192 type:complete len:88 (-) Transcript_8171:7-270(-)